MRNIFEFFKRHSWMWIIVIVIAAIIGDAFLTQQGKSSPSTTPAPQVASFNNIVPGTGSESDLNKIWGTLLKSTTTGQQRTNEYKGVGFRNQIAVIENGKVVLIREIIGSSDTTKSDTVTSVYGSAPNILYSKYPNYAFQLYVYPSNGIAYLGASDGTLAEIWYFVPTTIDSFVVQWGQDYQTTPPAPVQ